MKLHQSKYRRDETLQGFPVFSVFFTFGGKTEKLDMAHRVQICTENGGHWVGSRCRVFEGSAFFSGFLHHTLEIHIGICFQTTVIGKWEVCCLLSFPVGVGVCVCSSLFHDYFLLKLFKFVYIYYIDP